MIGISSSSAGVLLLPKTGTREYTVLDVVRGKEQDPIEAQYLYSAAQDWEEIEGTDADALLETATREYWLKRTVSFLRLAIGGLESSLEKRVFEEVEEILGPRVSSEKVIDRLLVAPLADPRSPLMPAQSALSYGFSAIASILDELAELQPLLHRLTDLWLSIDETLFSNFPESRETIWLTLVEKCGIKQLLKTDSGYKFTNKWNLLAFNFPSPKSRSGVSKIGKELSLRLFPGEKQEIITVSSMEEAEPTPRDEKEPVMRSHEVYERVKKEIAAISKAVSEGHDTKAESFLRQLIQRQTSFSGGERYAVKSLCSIAQYCADMFRMDFEAICLDKALQMDPSDLYALVQYGDHLKRVGNYDKALEAFEKAGQLGAGVVAKSSAADVYSQQGNYAQAILAYKAIANWSDFPEVHTAIADNLRKMGRMNESKAAYNELIHLAQQGSLEFTASDVRARVGIAEIAKTQGRFEDALRIYDKILKQEDIDYRSRHFYKLGLCTVLKLMDKYKEAYVVADEVVQECPFAMSARFVRGSILGLIGKELEGLKDLPESGPSRSWREWLRPYYRGLLLLKLKRYGEAKKALIEELPKAIASGEEKDILRMAAALCFLGEEKTFEADRILSDIPNLHDCNTQYLSLVLKLHSATYREDIAVMDSLRKQIAGLKVVDVGLKKAVVALEKKDFSLALTYETDAFLKLAA